MLSPANADSRFFIVLISLIRSSCYLIIDYRPVSKIDKIDCFYVCIDINYTL